MTLYVLLGPTAVGKTEFALQMAEKLGSPILNCDSRQMYRGMEIGTASPTEEQQRRVKHYFVGTLDIGTYYSAAQYEQDVLALISELSSTHQSLLLSGGSMMYLDAVCNGIDDIPTVDAEVRETLRQRLLSGEIDEMRSELHLLDPDYYLSADTRNPKRVVHALEVCYTTGRPYSSFLTRERKPRPFSIVKIGLRRERQDLFDRINRRVDTMMEPLPSPPRERPQYGGLQGTLPLPRRRVDAALRHREDKEEHTRLRQEANDLVRPRH